MNRKSIISMALAATMIVGCSSASGTSATGSDSKGRVYYLNFKPEADEYWQDLAKEYTEETGVPVTVLTAASGEYEKTLKSEMAKSEAPTLFQVNGPVGLASWKDYCADLSGTDVDNELTNKAYELKDGDKVAGIGYVTEAYGLITNNALLKKAGYDASEITSFDKLKEVAEDITARKDELGFSAFTSAGMDGSSDWRFKTHLDNLPIYYEYQADGVDNKDELSGKYLDNYKAVWDLYINNSTCDPSELSAKTGDDSRNEFLAGEAVFFQNGSWEYGNLTADGALTDDDLAMIPIYIGAGDEANQGLCTGTENYWCVNNQADEADVQATLDFMNWCVTSETGTKSMANDMGFTLPFKTAQESTNVFVNQDAEYTEAGKTPVSWNFTTMPSEEWKNGLGTALTAYAAGTGSWDDVVSAFVDGWATEKALSE